MPLIIVTGLPTSGKSTRACQLHDYLADRIASSEHTKTKYRLHLLSDDALSLSRAVYDLSPVNVPAHTRSSNASEKDARVAIYATVKRHLSDRDFVILDGLNYIKGWRYQLHCEAKAVRTPSSILQVGCALDQARRINEERLRQQSIATRAESLQGRGDRDKAVITTPTEGFAPVHAADASEAYEPSNWENLVFRYEQPNPMTCWDSPLFTLIWDDDNARARDVFAAMWDALAGENRPVVKPNQSTVQNGRDASSDYLYILERETQNVVRGILDCQTDGSNGGVTVKVLRCLPSDDATPDTNEDGKGNLIISLPVGKRLALPQLQRLRRAFVALNRGGIGLETVRNMRVPRVREAFVRFLNDKFENEA